MTLRRVLIACFNAAGGFLLGMSLAGGGAGLQAWRASADVYSKTRNDPGGGALAALGMVTFAGALSVIAWGAAGGVLGTALAMWEGRQRKSVAVTAVLGILIFVIAMASLKLKGWM